MTEGTYNIIATSPGLKFRRTCLFHVVEDAEYAKEELIHRNKFIML